MPCSLQHLHSRGQPCTTPQWRSPQCCEWWPSHHSSRRCTNQSGTGNPKLAMPKMSSRFQPFADRLWQQCQRFCFTPNCPRNQVKRVPKERAANQRQQPTRRPTAASRNAWKRAALQVTRGFHVGCRGSWSCGIPKAKRQVAMHSTLPLATGPMALCRLTDQRLVQPACYTAPHRNSLSEPSLKVKPTSATGLFEARCLCAPLRARQTQGEARRCRSWRAALSI